MHVIELDRVSTWWEGKCDDGLEEEEEAEIAVAEAATTARNPDFFMFKIKRFLL